MSFATWQSFVLIAAANIVTPGPAIVNTIRRSVDLGMRRTLASISGNALGLTIDGVCCAIGIGAVIARSDVLFTMLRWFGIAWLGFLGIRFLRDDRDQAVESPTARETEATDVSAQALFSEALLIALTNPKVFLFFIGLWPQFVDPDAALGPHVVLLLATYVGLSICSLSTYASLAGRFRHRLLDPVAHRRFRIVSGVVLLAFAAKLAIA